MVAHTYLCNCSCHNILPISDNQLQHTNYCLNKNYMEKIDNLEKKLNNHITIFNAARDLGAINIDKHGIEIKAINEKILELMYRYNYMAELNEKLQNIINYIKKSLYGFNKDN
jgi:hypothetical protein